MNISSYDQAREYLESFIRPSIYARVAVDQGVPHPLKRMQSLLEHLGNPQHTFRSVQVSGTAGKGSTSYLISHLLATAGYKTGLTLSPHLQKINERLQINGIPISDEAFITLVSEIVPIVEQMKREELGEPTYFELLVGLAFQHFAQEKIDIAVVEVGLEGRLDGTNTLNPLIGIITNIDLDHTEILGETVEAIAGEAVSIIKKPKELLHTSTPIIITGTKQESVLDIIHKQAEEQDVKVVVLGDTFTYEVKDITLTGSHFDFQSGDIAYKDIHLRLIGVYQIENAAIAIETICTLRQFGYAVSESHIRQALTTASFPGRFELFYPTPSSQRPMLLLDGAHNPSKMNAFLQALEALFPNQKKIFIVTFKKDKDVSQMLGEINRLADTLILTEFHRTIDTDKNASIRIAELTSQLNTSENTNEHKIITTDSATDALDRALNKAAARDIIIVTGSLYLVGEIRELLV